MNEGIEFISDKELEPIPVKDNGEKFVSISEDCPEIEVRPPDYLQESDLPQKAGKVRETVAKMLCQAQDHLLEGYKLVVNNGYRPPSVQGEKFEMLSDRLKKENPDWDKDQIFEEASKYIAPLSAVPPHTTGGAVDAAIAGPDGELIDMGAPLTKKSETMATFADGISPEAKKNRQMLIYAMTEAGFVNYPLEWWHWSYGDRYWAAVTGADHAIYGTVELD